MHAMQRYKLCSSIQFDVIIVIVIINNVIIIMIITIIIIVIVSSIRIFHVPIVCGKCAEKQQQHLQRKHTHLQ